MPTTKTITLYTFDELSDAAKERAREWYREVGFNYPWWDYTYEDAERVAEVLGITLEHKERGPAIYFQLSYSQGDGASFQGYYRYKARSSRAIRRYAPHDETLHRIADELRDAQRRSGYRITAAIRPWNGGNGVYVDWEDARTVEDGEAVQGVIRGFARWVYDRLREEYEYLSADEQVDEVIRGNGYTFTEDGKRE